MTKALGMLISIVCASCWLMACGTTPHLPTNDTAVTRTPTITQTTHNSALNGCQYQPPASYSGPNPAVILTQAQSSGVGGPLGGGTIAIPVSVGQVVEVKLAAHFQWNFRFTGQGLQVLDPASVYDPVAKQCLWYFRPQNPGVITINFTGTPVCPPDVACPAIALITSYTLEVH